MTAQITRQAIDSITIEVTMPLTGSMLQAEEAIQDALNEVGRLATEKNLQRFDTDGSPIQLGSVRMTSKGQFAQDYETPYGSISVLRHVYQTSEGGKTFCPLEERPNGSQRHTEICQAGLVQIRGSRSRCGCRRFTGMQSSKGFQAIRQVAGRHRRRLCRCERRDLELRIARVRATVHSIAIGVDGTCMLLQKDGWRLAMTGTIAFYDAQGERLHTIYAGATPEYGKEKFHAKFQREVEHALRAPIRTCRISVWATARQTTGAT